ncbi:hypothetical protein Q75_06790 [Bacillus coahuilensis p1.1.43]|uniref:Uncharacterized protein n=1 Tax=Bacillus coahuilensis p1.1.43 TaxID=1150625 RepID=A0A147K976_9BACI|nr:hypothetical protein [Bacillus coahuilensis]KUP06913.1 hypothetical protein Q75_06790 [Bacillus coahuilensis p1.1.43]
MKEKKAREMFEEGCHYFSRIKVQLNIEHEKNNRVKLILPQPLQNGQRELGFIANETKELVPRKKTGIIVHLNKDSLKALNMEKELKK